MVSELILAPLAHLVENLRGVVDHQIRALRHNVQLRIGDEHRNLEQSVPSGTTFSSQARHLAVDPDQCILQQVHCLLPFHTGHGRHGLPWLTAKACGGRMRPRNSLGRSVIGRRPSGAKMQRPRNVPRTSRFGKTSHNLRARHVTASCWVVWKKQEDVLQHFTWMGVGVSSLKLHEIGIFAPPPVPFACQVTEEWR